MKLVERTGTGPVYAIVVNLGLFNIQFLRWNRWLPVVQRNPRWVVLAEIGWGIAIERHPNCRQWTKC